MVIAFAADASVLECVERGIAPPLRAAVTIPVSIEGYAQVVVYVAVGAFQPRLADEDALLVQVAQNIVRRLDVSNTEEA